MPEHATTLVDRARRAALAAQLELDAHLAVGAPVPTLCEVVERLADRLWALVAETDDGPARRDVLAWRDLLSGHSHAARALADLEVDPGLALDVLDRGVLHVVAAATPHPVTPANRLS